MWGFRITLRRSFLSCWAQSFCLKRRNIVVLLLFPIIMIIELDKKLVFLVRLHRIFESFTQKTCQKNFLIGKFPQKFFITVQSNSQFCKKKTQNVSIFISLHLFCKFISHTTFGSKNNKKILNSFDITISSNGKGRVSTSLPIDNIYKFAIKLMNLKHFNDYSHYNDCWVKVYRVTQKLRNFGERIYFFPVRRKLVLLVILRLWGWNVKKNESCWLLENYFV